MTPVMRRRRWNLVFAGSAILAIILLLYWQIGALFPFVISAVLALVLSPLVSILEKTMPWRERRPGLTRILSISLIYVGALLGITGILALISPRIVRESSDFIKEFPHFFRSARATLERWNQLYSGRIPVGIRQNIEDALAGAGDALINAGKDALLRTFEIVSGTLTLVIGFATAPMFLFYLLKDRESLAEGTYGIFPSSIRCHLRQVALILNDTIGAYIRGQFILGLIVGTVVGLSLFFLGIPFPLLLGVIAGITELIPIIGPWIGGIAGILVTLATSPDKILWVILLYLVVQLVENIFLVPRIQGKALGLHPIAVMLVIVIGSQLMGLWGVILGPLMVAAFRDLFKYFTQEWNTIPAIEEQLEAEPVSANNERAAEGETPD